MPGKQVLVFRFDRYTYLDVLADDQAAASSLAFQF
jgi:hypothetical protein